MAKERESLEVQSEKAVLAAVRLPGSTYDQRDPFGELRALAEQAGALVVGELQQRLERPVAGTFMGVGKIEELKNLCAELGSKTIIFDHDLSPRQISNIEKATLCKVVDRSELILDIFASRATTNEAKLQVELAQLEYTAPRLRAMWSHLERISGGVGSRGPGEMQIEIDRRLVADRKVALKRDLEVIQARRRREVQARKREHFTVGIVGYTNAGKSTLFNSLTAGGAYADNRLFATLVTRTRQWDVGPGISVMLSDTVGFVRDIPHHLVASFKATLEEATHADLLLIVLDISDPAAELHYNTVTSTLDELMAEVAETENVGGEKGWKPPPRILLLNKADRVQDNRDVLVWQRKVDGAMPLCALPPRAGDPAPTGQEELRRLVLEYAQGGVETFDVTVPLEDAKTISLIERQGQVLSRDYAMDAKPPTVTLRARIGRRQLAALKSAGARLELADERGERVVLSTALDQASGWGR
ncbi:MAG TPA: GTPase HflX [Phycisphaerales bacterium]|nr:GTPase HflX [Phycisphaerales bacterium]